VSSLNYRATGAEIQNDNVVVLLHGLFGSKGNLLSIGRVLSDRFHVLAVDLPGHGDSAPMKEMTFTNMANALQLFLRELDITRVHIVGHSLGAKVAMQFATLFPELTSSVTVLDISPVTYKGRGHDPVFQAVKELDLEDGYTGPALVLKGELSAYIQTKHKELFKAYLPKATHYIVEGAGHWLHAEKPKEVQQHILRFLSKLI